MKLIIKQSPPLPPYLVPLKPKYLPQHPLFEHFEPVVFPQHERPRLTPTPTLPHIHTHTHTQRWQHRSSAPVGSTQSALYLFMYPFLMMEAVRSSVTLSPILTAQCHCRQSAVLTVTALRAVFCFINWRSSMRLLTGVREASGHVGFCVGCARVVQ